MPLAIELAAARIRVLAVEQIAARLDDRFKLLTGGSRTALPRHQTLRAVIDWSYDLLSEPEQTLFRRLSIFAGGWTLEAVESVCHPSDALDLLSNLVNKSLIVVERPHTGAARYHMLETVRQYSHDRLIETGELDSIRGRHFEFFLRLAEESELKLLSAERRTWLERLEVEHDNVRAALDHRPSSGYGESTARLAGALFWFWQSRGYLSEACARLGRILQAMPEDVSVSPPGEAAVWAKALWAAGSLAWLQGDYASGRSQLEESVKIWRQLGASGERGLAISLRELVIAATYQGDLTSARSVSEESIRLCRKTASWWDLALALYNQGLVYEMQDERAVARSNFEASLSLFRELNEMWGASVALFGLGRIAGRQGDYVTALSLLEECLALLRADKDPLSIAEALYLLGEVAQRLGDTERAARRYAECLALTQDMGDAVIVGLALHNLGKLAQLHGQLGRAARLFAAAKSFRDPSASTTPWSLASHADCEQDIATLHSALGDVVFEAAQAEGQAMTLAQAISYALEDDAGLPRE
jgi:tetratricopeptide (TPR) repeat protein